MITVNTNMASIIAQNSFNKCSNAMNKALGRLSTGYKINSSKDDAAGSAIAAKLETKISSYAQATKNAEMGADYLQSADSTLSTMQSMVQRMRDLTEQAANGTYGDDERKAIQSEINGLTKELYRIKNTTEFNGKKILGEEEEPIVKPNVMISAITNLDTLADGTVIGISTSDDIEKLSQMAKDGQKTANLTFVLTNDIDMSSIYAKGGNHEPIGTGVDRYFKGTFDGNGHTISNLKECLFAKIDGATIKNLDLNNVSMTGTWDCAALVATAKNSIIENCSLSDITVIGYGRTGGLAGKIENTKVSYCNVETDLGCEATCAGAFGGLIGLVSNNSIIENCTATGNIDIIGLRIGGLVGILEDSTCKNCYASSETLKGANYIGGLIGECSHPNTVENCVSVAHSIENLPPTGLPIIIGAFIGIVGNDTTVTNCKLDKCIIKGDDPIKITGGNVAGAQIDAVANPQSPVEEPEDPQISVETNLQVGIQADELSTISIDTGFAIGNFKVDVSTDKKAQKSLAKIDKLLDKMISKRTDIGASLNRLDSVMSQQETMRTSMTSALSQIKDADIAKESANYVKNQILQQTTASLLATANQNPNIALNLL